MRQLIYVSNASSDFVDGDAAAIIETSHRRNAEVGISGFLLFNGRNFLQLIEGEDEAISDLVMRLHADPRHAGMVIMEDHQAHERCCPNWAMHFISLINPISSRRETLAAQLPAGLSAGPRRIVLNFANLA